MTKVTRLFILCRKSLVLRLEGDQIVPVRLFHIQLASHHWLLSPKLQQVHWPAKNRTIKSGFRKVRISREFSLNYNSYFVKTTFTFSMTGQERKLDDSDSYLLMFVIHILSTSGFVIRTCTSLMLKYMNKSSKCNVCRAQKGFYLVWLRVHNGNLLPWIPQRS